MEKSINATDGQMGVIAGAELGSLVPPTGRFALAIFWGAILWPMNS